MSIWEPLSVPILEKPEHTCRGQVWAGNPLGSEPRLIRLTYRKTVVVMDSDDCKRRDMELYSCHGCREFFGVLVKS